MDGLFDLRDWIALRRKVYLVLVLAGLTGLFGWIMVDSERMLALESLPAMAKLAVAAEPLTSGQAMDGFGAWAPDGRQIAFMRNGQIWLVDASGKGARRLTNAKDVWDAVPVWRPDGKEIAFARVSTEGDGAFVMVRDVASGKERVLSKETAAVGHVAWDPTGKQLYYTTPQRMMRVDAKTGKGQQVLEIPEDWDMQAGGLAITADGKAVVFGAGPRIGRNVQYDLQLFRFAEPEKGLERLTKQGGIMPAFDRTGAQLAYRSPREASGIYVMDFATHNTRQVVADEGRALYFHPSFSPDGKRLLISRLLVGSTGGGPDGSRLQSHLFVHTLTN